MQNQYNPVNKCNKPTQQQGITVKRQTEGLVFIHFSRYRLFKPAWGLKPTI